MVGGCAGCRRFPPRFVRVRAARAPLFPPRSRSPPIVGTPSHHSVAFPEREEGELSPVVGCVSISGNSKVAELCFSALLLCLDDSLERGCAASLQQQHKTHL